MRLIDADTLEGRILMDAHGFMDGGSEITKAFILAMIKTRSVTPTVDAVPVVRCKYCVFGEQINDRYICINAGHCQSKSNKPDWFCADGRRRTDDA